MNNQQHELTTEQVYDLAPEEEELRRRASAPTLRDLTTTAGMNEAGGAAHDEARAAASHPSSILEKETLCRQ